MVQDQPTLHAKVSLALRKAVEDSAQWHIPVTQPQRVKRRREGYFGVPHTLRRFVGAQLVGNPLEIVGQMEAFAHTLVVGKEAGQGRQRRSGRVAQAGRDGNAVACGQLDKGGRADVPSGWTCK